MPKRGENIRKRKDGRWEGRYIKEYSKEEKAKYVSVYGSSYLETKKKLLLAKENLQYKTVSGKCGNICYRELLFLWLSDNKIKLRPQTYAKYLNMIENHLAPTIGTYKISKIDTPLINSFLEDKLNNGRLDGKGGLSTSYVKTMIYIINASMDFAVKQGYRHPLSGEINKPAQRKKYIQVLTVEEQRTLERYISQDIDGTKLGILICLHAGLRIGEVCGLRWNDIDFEDNTIKVRKTVQRIKNYDCKNGDPKTKLVIGEPKTISSYRVIPIPSYLVCTIFRYQEKAASDYVISDNSHKCIDPRTCQYRFSRYLEKCSIRHINFHALRHTFATRCIEVGVDIKSLSEILGHASVNITLNTYVHSSLEQKRCQIELLNSIRGQ